MHHKPDLILHGRVPSKKNQKEIKWSYRKRHSVLKPSDLYIRWHRDATLQLKQQSPKKHTGEICTVELVFWMPDNRGTDLTNKAESVMDLLVFHGIIDDDKWQVVPEVKLKTRGIDREDTRVLIWIYKQGAI